MSSVSTCRTNHSARRFSEERNQVVGELWYAPGVLDRGAANLEHLTEEGAIVDIRFEAERAPAIQFRVENEEGTLLARVEVLVQRRMGQQPPAPAGETGRDSPLHAEQWEYVSTARTGADGRTELHGLTPGRYRASIERAPVPYGPWFETTGDGLRFEREFTLGDAEGLELSFVLSPGRRLHGEFVLTGAETPPAIPLRVDFVATHSRVEAAHSGLSFVAEGFAPDTLYRMRVFSDDQYWRLCPIRVLSAGRVLQGDDIVVEDESPPLIVEVVPCATILGNGATGHDSVHLQRIGGELISTALVDDPGRSLTVPVDDGHFVFRGIIPGRYRLAAGPSGAPVEFEVQAGETREQNLDAE